MEAENLLPCRSCGHQLSDSATSCPYCGDTTPFYIDAEALKQRGEADGKKVKRYENVLYFAAFAIPVLLYFIIYIWWVSVILFVILCGVVYYLRYYIEEKVEDQFEEEIDENVRYNNNVIHYNLTENQQRIWKNRACFLYYRAKGEILKD